MNDLNLPARNKFRQRNRRNQGRTGRRWRKIRPLFPRTKNCLWGHSKFDLISWHQLKENFEVKNRISLRRSKICVNAYTLIRNFASATH